MKFSQGRSFWARALSDVCLHLIHSNINNPSRIPIQRAYSAAQLPLNGHCQLLNQKSTLLNKMRPRISPVFVQKGVERSRKLLNSTNYLFILKHLVTHTHAHTKTHIFHLISFLLHSQKKHHCGQSVIYLRTLLPLLTCYMLDYIFVYDV